jgi:HSP20 family protein
MLTLWRPHHDLFRWSREFDRLFDAAPGNGDAHELSPAVDIDEEETRFVIHADLPGMDQKDIEVRVHEGTLLLAGKRESKHEEKKGSAYYRERCYGSFARRFKLGSSVDDSKIEATYENGVLTVVLPKKEEVKPRQIPVHSA